MPIETFAWSPERDAQGDITYRTRTAQFGDGYAQVVGDGINNRQQSWPLTFIRRREEAQAILDFFDQHAGHKAFLWTPPLGQLGLWRVATHSLRPMGGGVYTITATFEQAFAP
ncbi:phage tail protein [Azotobacter vinelandii]|uniref:phage tail protein n=1 Tax=Azotobacter vinelandii TaxID=354 RepID=UPI002666282B|nr:phage tail protein [Azotobacter vinelandii]WKN20792.1 phage tail protein [Azotobacter vinelandii]